MNLVFDKWSFNPGLLSSLLTLIFISLFICLGIWQLNRAEFKRELYAEFKEHLAAQIIDLNNIGFDESSELMLWRRATVSGHFFENKQVLLDNQVMNGVSGYFIYTLLHIDEVDKWLLVNRGWIAMGSDRMSAPILENTDSEVTINGVIKAEPKTGLLLKKATPEIMTDKIVRVQKIDLKELEMLFNKKLLPVIFRLEPDSDHGYAREWQVPGSGEAVHLGYAFQWFAFAFTLLVIYVVLNVKKVEH